MLICVGIAEARETTGKEDAQTWLKVLSRNETKRFILTRIEVSLRSKISNGTIEHLLD